MSEVKFGFIGTGNMGSAIARAVRKSLPGHEILLSDKNEAKAQSLATEFGCRTADTKTVAREAQYVVLGVKPQVLPAALAELKEELAARRDRFVIVTMVAGVPIAFGAGVPHNKNNAEHARVGRRGRCGFRCVR